MKNFIFSILLMLGYLGTEAQPCKPMYEAKDEFTGLNQVYYGGELDESGFFSDKNLLIGFIAGKNGDSLNASAFIRRQIMDKTNGAEIGATLDDLRINKGQELYLSLSNGESVKLVAITDSKRERKKVLSTVVISTTAVYGINKDQLKLLSENSITGYRIVLAETLLQNKKLKTGRTGKMQEQMKCAYERFK